MYLAFCIFLFINVACSESYFVRNKRLDYYDEAKLFENIQETSTHKVSTVPQGSKDNSLRDIKGILEKVLDKLNQMDATSKHKAVRKASLSSSTNPTASSVSGTEYTVFKFNPSILNMNKRNENTLRKPRWGQWTAWSTCSVSCGKGREIRWRHCLEECELAETEMEEKSCQLPACAPGKLFGIKL